MCALRRMLVLLWEMKHSAMFTRDNVLPKARCFRTEEMT